MSAYAYFIADDDDYILLMGSTDSARLHLEARYNYEDLDTGSVWAGYNLAFGTELAVAITPMLGVAFGRTNGIAPGYEASMAWNWLDVYIEGEYLIDTEYSGRFVLLQLDRTGRIPDRLAARRPCYTAHPDL